MKGCKLLLNRKVGGGIGKRLMSGSVDGLFGSSLSCSALSYNGRQVYLLGDMNEWESSLSRINDCVTKMNLSSVLVENEDESGAPWKRQNPKGKVVKESYLKFYSNYYPNMGNALSNYLVERVESHGLKTSKIVNSLNSNEKSEEKKTNIVWAQGALSSDLIEKSRSGGLHDLVTQFKEEYIQVAKKQQQATLKKRREATPPDREPVTFWGTMEGVDEEEIEEQYNLELAVVKDLQDLAINYFDDCDVLLNAQNYNKVYNIVFNNNNSSSSSSSSSSSDITCFDKLLDRMQVRRFTLNYIIRNLEFDFNKLGADFWQTMRLLYADRDRVLFRLIRQECDRLDTVNNVGPVLAVVDLPHVYGVQTLWNSEKFWKSEKQAMAWARKEGNRDIRQELRQMNAPFMDEPSDSNSTK